MLTRNEKKNLPKSSDNNTHIIIWIYIYKDNDSKEKLDS